MIVTSNLIQTPKVVTIDQNRWSRSVKFTGHDLLEWVVTVDQNTQQILLPNWSTPALPIQIVSPPQRKQSAKVKAFVQHLTSG